MSRYSYDAAYITPRIGRSFRTSPGSRAEARVPFFKYTRRAPRRADTSDERGRRVAVETAAVLWDFIGFWFRGNRGGLFLVATGMGSLLFLGGFFSERYVEKEGS